MYVPVSRLAYFCEIASPCSVIRRSKSRVRPGNASRKRWLGPAPRPIVPPRPWKKRIRTPASFAEREEEIGETIANLKTITADLAKMSNKLDGAATSLQELLEEDAPQTLAEAEAFLTESRALVGDLRGVVDENRESVRIFTDQGLAQVAPAVAEFRRLVRTLDYMLREIDRDPQAYFLGENAPEYGAEEK